MAPRKIELFYDIVSPYSYLAAVALERYTRGHRPLWDLELVWRPAFLGGVFKLVGNVPPASLPQRAPYLLKDLTRLARLFDVPMAMPDPFPADTLRCMRLLTAVRLAEPVHLGPLSLHLWRRHWGEGREVHSDEALLGALGACRVGNAEALLARTGEAEVKAELKRATDEVVARGAFGFPAYFVDLDGEDELFFGSDRLELFAFQLGLPWRGPRAGAGAGS